MTNPPRKPSIFVSTERRRDDVHPVYLQRKQYLRAITQSYAMIDRSRALLARTQPRRIEPR